MKFLNSRVLLPFQIYIWTLGLANVPFLNVNDIINVCAYMEHLFGILKKC